MTPRPGDEDEDWEDDFVGFKAPPPGAVASAAPASNEDDFGSFTQISMPANGDTIENDDAAVAPSAEEALQLKKDSPLFNDPPAVETVGESSEFSQSETTEDVSAGAAGSTTMLASRTESVVSDNTDDAMAPTLLEPHGEDAVVDKDTSERSEGEEKKNIPEAGNDDSFGDFGGFSQPPSPAEDKVSAEVDILASPAAGSLEEENESKNIAPDAEMIEFGDSEEPETTVNQSAPIAVESVEKNVDFGDFGAVDDKKSDAPLSVDTVDNSDSFGDFGTAQVESPVDPIATHSTAGNETNGDFGTTEASKPNTEDSEPAVETADNSDSFGDFGAAEIVTPSGTDEPRSTTEGSSDDVVKGKPDLLDATVDDLGTSQPSGASNDDFGDFGAAASPPATEQDDDDFGDFGEAKSAPVSNDDKDDFGDVTSAKPEPATNDDFGDFGSAELSTEADGKDDGGEPGFAKPTEATKEDDDFGDFDAAQPADATNDDDDFGDFDDFDAAEPPEATNDDDDFGDFDVAKPTDTTSQDDGDDFGDFDAADPAPAANNDDEFGDFDAAGPAPAEKGDDDDFGDFNDVDDAPVGPPPSPAPQRSSSSLSASDPVLQNVTAAMHRMFQKPECQVEADSRESSDTASIEKSSIDELVVSMVEFLRGSRNLFDPSHQRESILCSRNLCRRRIRHQASRMNFLLSGTC